MKTFTLNLLDVLLGWLIFLVILPAVVAVPVILLLLTR